MSTEKPARATQPADEMVGTLEYEFAKYFRSHPVPDPPEAGLGDFVMEVDHEALEARRARLAEPEA